MRTTVRIDDDLVLDLKERARREKLSLNRLLNQVLRRSLKKAGGPRRVGHREPPAAMGPPQVNLDKALSVAAALDDEQTLAKLAARK
jgi:hypothetical protein